MTKDKEKQTASWDTSVTWVFIKECIEQIYQKERVGLVFTKKGWDNIISGFNSKTGRSYTKKQFKNRLDALRKKWKAWDDLFSKETDIWFDWSRNMIIADDEWWHRKIRENPAYNKYRHSSLMYGKELQIIFKDVTASRDDMLAPSSTQHRPLDLNEDGVYQPTMDLEEGSGDSEEDLESGNPGGNVGVSNDFQGFTLGTGTPLSVVTSSESIGKRKRVEGFTKSRKKTVPTTKQIADAASTIGPVSKERADARKKIRNYDVQIQEVLAELVVMSELQEDPDFCLRCCNMMMYPLPRAMYLGLRGNRGALLRWLRHHAYKSPQYQKSPAPIN